ncbi:30S ribosomal protein S19e [Acidianus sulfidivorans JP7]|uniref:Small ribosomal subunit protein eS19 n=1 Tax=Acidianus sulfidivorans JP7 TaxID=619593 RepID=A0A2U9INZ3_9CREN|nr:30S ribosomal protein S19e [Acidianus sulfidivorans]AWR97707.1 30S ribosomal protein S19e [Acidianus sulfidivorans JP7]
MITANMVPANALIEKLSSYIKDNIKEVQPPEWALLSKTASFKERVPDNIESWWYIRAASLMRKLYINSFGVEKSKTIYGGIKTKGSNPPHVAKAPGHATRLIFQQLEKAGLVTKTKDGRKLSPKGLSLLDKLSYEIFKDLAEKNTTLKKYLE